MTLRRMLSDVSGSRKSKMAAVKPEMHVSQLVVGPTYCDSVPIQDSDTILTLIPTFSRSQTQHNYCQHCPT